MKRPTLLALVVPVLMLLLVVCPVAAQEMTELPAGGLASQSLRAYWHVFIAYAIVLVMVLGWVVSIARRLSHIEARIPE